MDLISLYLRTGQLPSERDKAHKLQVQSARFSLVDGQLFKRSLGGPYLKCLTPKQSQYVLAELHEGICGNHPGGRTLAHRAHTQGYYWPTMRADAANYTRKCDRCQRLAPILKSPARSDHYFEPLTLCSMGNRYSRTTAYFLGPKEVIIGGH